MNNEKYEVFSIGHVKSSDYTFQLEIENPFKNGLKYLDNFSHVIVFWWADKHDNEEDRRITETDLPYAKGVSAGVFACRSEYRPNPIAMTICSIQSIDAGNGIVKIGYMDAFNGTPILDLKPYIPVSERIRDVKVADWFSDFPHWYEDGPEFFMENYHLLFGNE